MLEGMTPPKPDWPCAVRTVLGGLTDKDQQILNSCLDDVKEWPSSTLAKELRRRGIVLSDNAIKRHRVQGCSCKRGQNA